MEIKPAAQIQNVAPVVVYETFDQIQTYFQNVDWTNSTIDGFKHKDEKVRITLEKDGKYIDIKCKGLTKFSFQLVMEDLEIRRLFIKQKEEGIKLRVGPIKVMAQSIKVIQRV